MRRALACAVVAGLLGCGQVVFVDPGADAKARLQLEGAEHLLVEGDPRLYLHVRLETDTSTAGTELVAETDEGSFQLPWADAAPSACGAERRCLAFTLPPGLPAPSRVTLLAPALVHRDAVEVTRVRLPGYAMVAAPRDQNRRIRVDLDDPIRAHYADPLAVGTGTVTRALAFERDFELHVAPGPCGAPPAPDDPAWRGLSAFPGDIAVEFSAEPEGLACAWARPARPAGGPAAVAATVEVRAEVTRFRHVYSPPVKRAPIVFLPFFDLEIPNPARCEEAEGLVLSAVLDAATDIAARTGVPVLPLAPEEIAEVDGVACRQATARSFDADAVVRRTAEAIEDAFGPDEEVRVLWLYAENLDLGLPNGLEQSFSRLRALLRANTPHSDMLFTLAPNRLQDQLQSDRHLAWLATEEPQFRASIGAVLGDLWPFSSVIHAGDTEIFLLPRGQADRFEAYRVCASSIGVLPLGEPIGNFFTYAPPEDGPGFSVSLPTQRLLPSSAVNVPNVTVEWEGCAGYCERGAPSAVTGVVPWLELTGC